MIFATYMYIFNVRCRKIYSPLAQVPSTIFPRVDTRIGIPEGPLILRHRAVPVQTYNGGEMHRRGVGANTNNEFVLKVMQSCSGSRVVHKHGCPGSLKLTVRCSCCARLFRVLSKHAKIIASEGAGRITP